MNKKPKNKEKFKKSNPVVVSKKQRYLGYLFALLTALCAALSYGFTKLYNGNRVKAVVVRCVLQTLCVWPLISYKNVDVFRTTLDTTVLLIIRGLTSGCAVITLSLAVAYLPVGDVIAIFYSFPAMVGIMAWIFLKGKHVVVSKLFKFSNVYICKLCMHHYDIPLYNIETRVTKSNQLFEGRVLSSQTKT